MNKNLIKLEEDEKEYKNLLQTTAKMNWYKRNTWKI